MKQSILSLYLLSSTASAWNVGPSPSNRQQNQVLPKRSAVAIPLDIPTSVENDVFKKEIMTPKSTLAPEDAWIANLDYEAFRNDVNALGKELLQETGEADVQHLNKIVQWRDIAGAVGLATIWMPPNPVTVAALSTWIYSSWTMIGHHVCHGGYNRVDAGKFKSRNFALGVVNRVKDWLDAMLPEAWNVEHNRLHHYRLSESKDPDLVQRNLEFLRSSPLPMPAKYAVVAFFLPIWKWFYYSPNTYKELKISEWNKEGRELPKDFNPEEAATIVSLLDPSRAGLRQVVNPVQFFIEALGPLLLARFIAIPAMLALIPGVGGSLALNALINLVLADFLTNIHAFITIVTNHAGEDLYTFDDCVKPKTGSFYVRQIVASANYAAGSDAVDFSHGWLNYQIEHHVWPDLSMLQYQRAAPKLKAICEKHGVPYIQESVFERLRKTVDIMIGKTTMREFPTEYEPPKDKTTTVTWTSTNGAIDG
ncbi:fatty acid desaturase [Nitzschia inconspicua]|uniref:Fatty acid desaturase n=1 Tax=Nitzschia inconspicua TaxID=303405 RepID=A0A9K3KXR2_9STRA|nr:fatty acid desaturase [Nitzschia inconspicua]